MFRLARNLAQNFVHSNQLVRPFSQLKPLSLPLPKKLRRNFNNHILQVLNRFKERIDNDFTQCKPVYWHSQKMSHPKVKSSSKKNLMSSETFGKLSKNVRISHFSSAIIGKWGLFVLNLSQCGEESRRVFTDVGLCRVGAGVGMTCISSYIPVTVPP